MIEMLESIINFRFVMIIHGAICIVLGGLTTVLPHGFVMKSANTVGKLIEHGLNKAPSEYDHTAHEFIRLYGCITLGIGWFVWTTKSVKDARVMRAVSESFAVCYILQAIVMLRAHMTNPEGHSWVHFVISMAFLAIGLLYGCVRVGGKLKSFELPGGGQDE